MPAVTEKCTLLLAILSGPKFALLPGHSRSTRPAPPFTHCHEYPKWPSGKKGAIPLHNNGIFAIVVIRIYKTTA